MSEAPKLSQVIRLDSLPLNQTYFHSRRLPDGQADPDQHGYLRVHQP